MQFTAEENESEENLWKIIISKLDHERRNLVSPSSSSFYKTSDGIECSVRKANGSLIANCYSESDRMGNRRWTIDLQ
tara:strand:- start:425 stop:655 length:231 start_codon:yes stop_codon:yes gene_type:complete